MTISINQISNGVGLLINGDVYLVTDYSHVKPGKGSAFVRVKLKSIKSGQVLDRTFKSSEKLEDVPLEERKLQYLYQNGNMYHFMDLTSYEQLELFEEDVADVVKFLQENQEVTGTFQNSQCLKVNLPIFIVAEITQTEPGVKGDSSKAGTKPAVIDTGMNIQVPLFVDLGDHVKIDTRTGSYVERVQK